MVVFGLDKPSDATECAVTLFPTESRKEKKRVSLNKRGKDENEKSFSTYLAGKPADFKTPSTIPAAKEPQFKWPMSLGTEMYLFTSKS